MPHRKTRINGVLFVQILLLSLGGWCLWLFASNYPYPSPLIKPFLDPEHRWPREQVERWVKSEKTDDEFLAFFYRDPEREPPSGHNIVSPADGQIANIIKADDVTYIVIALSFWDVHVQRSPAEGVLSSMSGQGDRYMNGEGREMVFLRAKNSPVQKIVSYKTEWGEIKVRLITSLLARRIQIWQKLGQQVKKGERLGRILLGSTVVLELPDGMSILVDPGQRVVGGETIISWGWKQG